MSNYCANIFDFIKEQESAYKMPIRLNDSWDWSMKDHIDTTELYNNSQLKTGKNDFKPVKNITRPILNLQHRTEDIEVKDVQIYVDNPEKYHLSLLVKKYHDDVFVIENDVDTFLDDLNISRIDFGAGLSKKLKKPCPEVVPLQSIAFCNQRDMLASPIGIVHEYGASDLIEMEKYGWGTEAGNATATVSELLDLWRDEEKPSEGIKVYEVHGMLPKRFLTNAEEDEEVYENMMFIVSFYTPKGTGEKKGVTLYATTEPESPFKLIKRDKIYGRALGFGGAEELFEAQVWTNYDMIRMQNMLDAAAVTILQSSDPTVSAKHPKGLKNMKNLEIVDVAPGSTLGQVDTFPRNMALFEKSVANWEAHAQQMGAANDAIMGESPSSGTPFKLQELVTSEAHGLHEYRRQQYAKHIEEIYYDWIIPHIEKKICEGTQFLSELSLEELNYVADKISVNAWNSYATEKILNGQDFAEGEKDQWIQDFKDDFKKTGNKRFIELLKGEFKGSKLGVKVSVAGKSKNLAQMTDKIVNIFRFAFSNPQGFAQVMQIPGMGKSFNQILEFSGMSQVDFAGIDKMAIGQSPEGQPLPANAQPNAPTPQIAG
jgi:hypothetical protein